jgi:ADP-heptose:LPS heptosyltransferase
MAKLGDMVCTTPVFHALKHSSCHPHVTVMGNKVNKELLVDNTDVDEYLVFSSVMSAYRLMHAGHFDAVIVVTPDVVSVALAYLAGIPFIAAPKVIGGYSPFESLWYRSLRHIIGCAVAEHRIGNYAPREYLNLLKPLGIDVSDTRKHLAFSQESLKKVRLLFGNKEKGVLYVGMSPSAGNKLKNWGAERFAELALRISRKYRVCIVVFGGERDREETTLMVRSLALPVSFLDLSRGLLIPELKAAISLLDMFIAVDTGPIYIAEAFSVPTVDILGPVAEGEQAPASEFNLVVLPPSPRVPQMRIMNVHGYNLAELKRQIDTTTIDSVYDACDHLLQKIARAHD